MSTQLNRNMLMVSSCELATADHSSSGNLQSELPNMRGLFQKGLRMYSNLEMHLHVCIVRH